MCELNRKCCRAISKKYYISFSSLSLLSSLYVTRGKDGLLATCRSSEDAKPVQLLLKRSVEFCKRRSWLLANITWDFAKRLVREIRWYFWYLETSFLPFLKTGMTYGSSLKWIILLPEIYLLLQSRREEIYELICHWHNGLSLKRCLNHWTISWACFIQ